MYSVVKDEEWYVIQKDGQPLLTPLRRSVRTTFKTLADRLLVDIGTTGEDPSDPVSLVAFHYAMIDFFFAMPRVELEYSVAIGLNKEHDWTFNCPTVTPEPKMKWMTLFGTYSTNSESGKKWLSTLNRMQLCAVCVIGKALESVNIPYIVATMLSEKDILSYAKEINVLYPYVGFKDLVKYFNNFHFYFTLQGNSRDENRLY